LLKIIVGRFGTVALEDADGIHMQAWLTELAKLRKAVAAS
jgi:hypothetical protein